MPSEMCQLRDLEAENNRLKRIVDDLTLDQRHVMAQFDQFPCPMFAGSAGLNADQTWLKTFKERENLRPRQCAVECNLAMVIYTLDLKNVLSQIEADCCNLLGVAPLKS